MRSLASALSSRSAFRLSLIHICLEPENLAGRGLVRSTPPLEFQTALPAAGKREIDRVNEIRRLAGLMRGAWTGACPPPIPVLPEVVDWREYPSEQILCGLTEQSVHCLLYTS